MKKSRITILLLLVLGAALLAGCSESTADSAGKVYDSLVDLGKDIYTDVDGAIDKYGNTDTADGSALNSPVDTYEDKLKQFRDWNVVSGEDVLSFISGIKSADATMIIHMGGDDAIVVGKLLTADGTEYVEGLNELVPVDGHYIYDFCGLNGIIPKTIPTMANKNFKVCRYEDYNTNVGEFSYLTADYKFYKLNLYEGDKLVGFYFSEVADE